ncbi:Primase 2 (plasmid) [Gloeothece citriformis PCC 7424]|uniref:Primase 2 n=1 Tax=Gloeothece citriformis (strain PCC 7424) TaxID=65393 RepID=B7KMP2_GLOC7|nr:PriCT-2 domain-containing protein [Gloeothece citriformis]ACK74064.1 Primase 2 [Gloeothece citriformis PCC 7424]
MYARSICEPRSFIDHLSIIPPHWPLIPVSLNKQPIGSQWQNHPLTRDQLITNLTQRGYIVVLNKKSQFYPIRPPGIGILLGHNKREFLIALDVDGDSAIAYLHRLIPSLPRTVAFTSGRLGRCQYLFKLPSNQSIKPFKVITGPGEALEIRSTGQQSVLPPSPHPLTGQYYWVGGCNPNEVNVALAPPELITLSQSHSSKKKIQATDNNPFVSPVRGKLTTSIEAALSALACIHPSYADEYDSWIRIGMSLHSISYSLLHDWDSWSQSSAKYKPGECHYKWASFKGSGISARTLFWYVKQSKYLT